MKFLLQSILSFILVISSCGKSNDDPEISTTIFLQNDFTLPIQNVLIAYKVGGSVKLFVNLGYFDSNTDREVDCDQAGVTQVYVYYDIVRNGVLYTEMVIAPFNLIKQSRNTISLSALSQVKAISKTSSDYPGSAPSSGQIQVCGKYNGYQLYKGPDGGCYYINSNGNKTYVARSECNC